MCETVCGEGVLVYGQVLMCWKGGGLNVWEGFSVWEGLSMGGDTRYGGEF